MHPGLGARNMVRLDAPVKRTVNNRVTMFEVLRTNDPVLLSYASSVLNDAGIQSFTADTHMSIMDGSLIAIPRRLMVAAEDGAEAQKLLDEAIANPPGLAEDADHDDDA